MKKFSVGPFPQGMRVVQTPRLVLRQIRHRRDGQAMLDLQRNLRGLPETHRMFRDPGAFDRESRMKHGLTCYYGFLRPHRKKAVVMIGVMLDGERNLRVSYETHSDYRGRGLATEARTAIVKALEARYPHLPMAAEIDRSDKVSRHMLLKAGFQRRGIRLTAYPYPKKYKIMTFS